MTGKKEWFKCLGWNRYPLCRNSNANQYITTLFKCASGSNNHAYFSKKIWWVAEVWGNNSV